MVQRTPTTARPESELVGSLALHRLLSRHLEVASLVSPRWRPLKQNRSGLSARSRFKHKHFKSSIKL